MATVPVVSRGIGRKPPSQIRIENGVAIVTLSHGFETIIDIEDIGVVAGYHWKTWIHSKTGHAYAVRYEPRKSILMHRVLLDAPPGMYTDHVDGDGLNNRRCNIRLATQAQNMANKAVERRNKLGIKGVSADRGRFRATIKPNGKTIDLGRYQTPEEAAAAYRGAAKVLWGEFAHK